VKYGLLLIWFWVALAAMASPPDFALPDLQGAEHRLSDYRGKWILVNYWATWCPPCLKEIPELVEFQNRHRDKDALVIGVNLDDISVPRLRDWVQRLKINYLVLRAAPSGQTPFGAIPVLPASYLVDPQGNAVAQHLGPIESGAVEDFLEEGRAKAGQAAPSEAQP
jgi:thiol-disulfide isomerase/thioredoxin